MDAAISFLRQHFKHGLCYPVWIDDQHEEFVMRKVARRGSLGASDPAGVASSKGMDNSLLSIDSAHLFPEKRNSHINPKRNSITESRDACAEISLLGSLRDTSLDDDVGDLDEVIAKIIRKRDSLIQENLQATEEIQRLKLENENLKNLNAISKRITAAQREEITKLKLNAIKDKKQMIEMEEILHDLRLRTTGAKHALDGSSFLSGISSCQQRPTDISGIAAGKVNQSNTGLLDSVFGWTIGDEE